MLGTLASNLRSMHQALSRNIQRPTRQSLLLALTCAFLALGILVALTPRGFELGDAPYYADYIATRSLGYATKHIGYYLLGMAFTIASPIELTYGLNLLSALTGAASVGLSASIAYTLTGKRSAAVIAAALLMVPYTFLTAAVNAEVYAPQVCFFLLSLQLVLLARPTLAGLAFSIALLITPSTALLAPVVLVLLPSVRHGVRFAAAAGVPAVAILAPFYRDFLYGPHGVLGMTPSNLGLGEAFTKEAWEIGGFSLGLVFVFAGILALARSRSHRMLVAGLGVAWLLSFLLGERYSDVPVQLPLYSLLAVMGGIGYAWLRHRYGTTRQGELLLAALVVLSIATAAGSAYPKVFEETTRTNEMRESFEAMRDAASPGDVAVAPYPVVLLGRYYLGDEEVGWIDDRSLAGKNGDDEQREAQAQLEDALSARRRIWLPGEFDQSAYQFFALQGYQVAPMKAMFVARPTPAVSP